MGEILRGGESLILGFMPRLGVRLKLRGSRLPIGGREGIL